MEQRPTITLEMDRDLPQGIAHACDAYHRLIAEIYVPQQKPPPGTAILVLSIEDWVRAQKALGRVTPTPAPPRG